MSEVIHVKLPDGSVKDVPKGTSALDIAKSISPRLADAALEVLGYDGVLQVASFHPHYEFAGSTSNDIENCTNRSPYPMLHLLRQASVERAVAAFPDAATIYEANIETLRRLGPEGWRKLWLSA